MSPFALPGKTNEPSLLDMYVKNLFEHMSKDKVANCYKATAADTMNVWACRRVALNPTADAALTAVGFEPTKLSLVSGT